MTRALITGITGMVGSHLADYLLANTDWDIDGLIRWRSPLDNVQALVPFVNRGERVRFLYGDLHDGTSLRKAVSDSRPDYVFHLAAQSYPQTSFRAPCDTLDTNVQGTVRLLEAIKEFAPKAWVHVCSSSEVYGKVPGGAPIDESRPFHPSSPYAISKVGADLVARHYAEAYGMNIVVTRMFTHTGPRRGDVFMESSFAKQIAMFEADIIPCVLRHGNLESVRTIADVRDAVRAYHMLLTINPQRGEVYNIGGAFTCDVKSVIDELHKLSHLTRLMSEVDPTRLRPIDADHQIPDCSKFMKHTGWAPQIPFEQTMLDLLNYWRERVRTGAYLTR